MDYFFIGSPLYKNDKKGTASIKFSLFQRVLSGEFGGITLFSNSRGRIYSFPTDLLYKYQGNPELIRHRDIDGDSIVVLEFLKLEAKHASN